MEKMCLDFRETEETEEAERKGRGWIHQRVYGNEHDEDTFKGKLFKWIFTGFKGKSVGRKDIVTRSDLNTKRTRKTLID